MSRTISRGALIVLEGCDRCGKTTQAKRLVDALTADGIRAEMWRYPDRTTTIGKMVSDYLERRCELEDHAVHLLFAANRWETVPLMQEKLKEGITLVVDRYSFSGVAFSAAKESMSLDWCQQPEVGLPRPDAVLYLQLSAEAAAQRAAYGGERYEETNFQKVVAQNYSQLQESDWKIIDADKTIEVLHEELKKVTKEIIENLEDEAVGKLWVSLAKKSIDASSPPAKKLCLQSANSNGHTGESDISPQNGKKE